MRVSSLALDACCLLNLFAAGKILHENFTKTGFSFFVPRVVAKESIYILQPDDDHAGQLVRREVDMNQYVERKLVSYCDIERSCEAEWYVRFAVQIDDGEAACLAIAKSRSWILATDDRVARRLATEQSVKVLGTPEIVRTWAESNAVSESEISSVIGNIQRYAKYVPRSNVPDAKWWYQKQSAG